MRWVFLVGFMGVGKTTLGSNVAKRLRLPFFDLDEQIELDTGTRVPEIFEADGEDIFRNHETRVLQKLVETERGGMVATGGGAFTLERNRSLIAAAGISVWLDAPFETIIARVGREQRPVWRSEAEARELAQRRNASYRLANHHLELGADAADQGAERLYQLLAPHGDDT